MRCEECDKEFSSEIGYHQHMHDKHGVAMPKDIVRQAGAERKEDHTAKTEKKKRSIGTKNIVLIAVIVLLFVGVAWFVASTPGGSNPINTGNLGNSSNQTNSSNETNETNVTQSNQLQGITVNDTNV